jgi:hypothetical protein
VGEIKKNLGWLIAVIVACVGVVALGLFVGAVAPAWWATDRVANQATAIAKLNTIATEERVYLKEHGSYANFDQLMAEGALDKRFAGASPVVAGYIYTLKVTPRTGGTPPSFAANADPQQGESFNASGRGHYYVDSTGTFIRHSEDRPATADDPVLGER